MPENCRAAVVSLWAVAACFLDGPQAETFSKKTTRSASDFYNPIIALAVISFVIKSCTRTTTGRPWGGPGQNSQNQVHSGQQSEARPSSQDTNSQTRSARQQEEPVLLLRRLLLKRGLHVLPWLVMGLLWTGMKQLGRVRITEWRYM